jgi:hypothetical protein
VRKLNIHLEIHPNQTIDELIKLANAQDASGIKSKLKEIIPEYQPFQP